MLKALFAFSDPVVRYLGIEQGLSNNSVRCIYKDHHGFMWFGTYDGLCRFDGYEFKVFRNKLDDTASLPHNFIYTIREDLRNNLWVGTGQGIGIYNNLTLTFQPAYYLRSDNKKKEKIATNVNAVETDAKGNVYIATNGAGLLVRYKDADAAVQFQINKAGQQIADYNVQAIKVDQKQRVWLCIYGVGLCLFDPVRGQVRTVYEIEQDVNCLETDDRENVWIGTEDGLYQYHIPSGSRVHIFREEAGALTSGKVASLCIDRERRLWIGTEGGGINILHLQTGKVDHLRPGESKNALSSESVFSIYEDKEGRKWIGTLKGGINIIDPQTVRFQTIAHEPLNPGGSLVNNFVSSFCEDGDKNLWIGTDGGGMSIWNRRQNTFANFRHQPGNPGSLSYNQVTSIRQDHQGNTWIATFGGGVNKFNKAARSFEHFSCINDATGRENKKVWLLFEDRDQVLWATTFAEGKLYRLNREQNRFVVFGQELNDLFSITEDKYGVLWAGNSHQLIKVDKGAQKHVYYEIGKPVRAILEDKKGRFWLGTEGAGLSLFDRERGRVAARFTDADGLCNNSVLNILEDANGLLWLSTFNGLSRFNPADKSFKNYYQEDGLQSNQFLYNAALKLHSGELAFGGIKGFTLFHPDSIYARNNRPPVILTGLRINNNPVMAGSPYVTSVSGDKIGAVRIPYDEAVLSFNFAALEYSAPGKISYAYYLQGWDKGWNYSGALRTANYTRLGEGTYTLRVKATTADGTWNPQEVRLKIHVLPPWYRSWWAYILYALAAAGPIILYQRYRIYRSKVKYEIALARVNAEKEKAEREKAQAEYQREKAERETERVVAEKEKEVNEKRLSFFTNISHEFRTPLTLIINPVKDLLQKSKEEHKEGGTELGTVYRNARRLLSLVDQLLLFRKADTEADKLKLTKLDFCSLCREVYLYFVQQAKAQKIQYDFECASDHLELYGDREKLEIILYNLVSNALKYTPEGGKVTFEVRETDQNVAVVVSDTGQGIPPSAGDKLFEKFYQVQEKGTLPKLGFGIGLYLVKHFVDSHKGAVSYESEPGKGTTFTVMLRKGTAHFSGSVIFKDAGTGSFLPEPHLEPEEAAPKKEKPKLDVLVNDRQSLLVVDDNAMLRQYIAQIFQDKFTVYEASSGEEGFQLAKHYIPDMIISDVRMEGISGVDMCKSIKEDPATSHIPIILLTGSDLTAEKKLEGVESGADDYITKPFEKDLLVARVTNILKSRTQLQKYFYNEVTLQKNTLKISAEYKEFLDKCIAVVERHLDDGNFNIQTMATEMGMSHSSLYKKVKSVSGQSVNAFIRFIRLRRAAELFINSNSNVNEIAYQVGINDIKYFREQFHKLFGMKPSEYIKKYRKTFGKSFNLNEEVVNPKDE